LQKR